MKKIFGLIMLAAFVIGASSMVLAETYVFHSQIPSNRPQGLAYSGANDTLYVSEYTAAPRIVMLSPAGAEIGSWGRLGAGDGEFRYPFGVSAAPNGEEVCVTEWGTELGCNYRVQRFKKGGGFLTKWGRRGTRDADFTAPLDIAVMGFEPAYCAVLDSQSQPFIKLFRNNGEYISGDGYSGSANGQFKAPQGIAFDRLESILYIADTGNHRVQKLLAGDGVNIRYLDKWGSYGRADGQFDYPTCVRFARTPYGARVFVGDFRNNRVQVFDTSGRFITKFGQGIDAATFTFHRSNRSNEIAVDGAGYVYVTDTYNNRILKFAPVAGGAAIPTATTTTISPTPIPTTTTTISLMPISTTTTIAGTPIPTTTTTIASVIPTPTTMPATTSPLPSGDEEKK